MAKLRYIFLFMLMIVGVFNVKKVYALEMTKADLYSDDAIYAENNYDCDLYKYEKGCLTIKKDFVDKFTIAPVSTGKFYGDDKTYTWDSTNNYYSVESDSTMYYKYSVAYPPTEYEADIDYLNNTILSNLISNSVTIYGLTIADDVEVFPCIISETGSYSGLDLSFGNSVYRPCFNNIYIPEQVNTLSKSCFYLTCCVNLYCASESIHMLPENCFYEFYCLNMDLSKLNDTLYQLADKCFHHMMLYTNDSSLKNLYMTMFGFSDTLNPTQCNIVLPTFKNVMGVGKRVFSGVNLDNTVIDFSGNTTIVSLCESGVGYTDDTGLFTGVVCKEINLSGCTNLKYIGCVKNVDTLKFDMSGCNNIYALGRDTTTSAFGYYNGIFLDSQIDEVILPETCIELGDGAFNSCNLWRINLENVQILMGRFINFGYGKYVPASAYNNRSLYNRGKVNYIYRDHKVDLSNVKYWAVNYAIFDNTSGLLTDFLPNFQFTSKVYDNATFLSDAHDDLLRASGQDIRMPEKIWVIANGNYTMQDNPIISGADCLKTPNTLGWYLSKSLEVMKVEDKFLHKYGNYTSSKYSISYAPTYGFNTRSAGDGGYGSSIGSNLTLDTLKKIYTNGIDDFIDSFTLNSNSVYQPWMVANGFRMDFNLGNKTWWSSTNGMALIADDASEGLKNAYDMINNAKTYLSHMTSDYYFWASPIMYQSNEYIEKIHVDWRDDLSISDLSDATIQSLTKRTIRKYIDVWAEFMDGSEDTITDFDISDYTYNPTTHKVSLHILVRNLPSYLDAEEAMQSQNYGTRKTYDVDSEDFMDVYEFTVAFDDDLEYSVVKSIDGINITGSSKVMLGASEQYTEEIEHTGYLEDDTVTWSIEGGTSSDTVVDADGILTVGSDESARTLTLKVVSNGDSSVTASKTLNVTRNATNVTVTGREVLMPNATAQYTAQVEGELGVDENVTWSIVGNSTNKTKITDDGVLKLSKDEESDSIIVKAVSSDESGSKVGQLTVSICYDDITGADEIQVDRNATYTATAISGITTEWVVDGNTSADTEVTDLGVLFIGEDESADTVKLRYQNVDNANEGFEKEVSVKQRLDNVVIVDEYFELDHNTVYTYNITVNGSPNVDKTLIVEVLNDKDKVVVKDTVTNGKFDLDTYSLAHGKTYKLRATSVFDTTKSDTTNFNIKVDPENPNITNNTTNNYYPVTFSAVTNTVITENNYYSDKVTNNYYHVITGSAVENHVENNWYNYNTTNNYNQVTSSAIGGSTTNNYYYGTTTGAVTENNYYDTTTNNYYNTTSSAITENNYHNNTTNNYNSVTSSSVTENNYYDTTTNNYNTVSSSSVTENNYYSTTNSAVTENNYYTDTTNNYHVVSGGSVVENNYYNTTNSAITENNYYTDTTNNYNTVSNSSVTENNYYNTTNSAVTENNYYTDTTNNYNTVSNSSVTENNYYNTTNSAVIENNYYTDTTNNYNTVSNSAVTENNYYNTTNSAITENNYHTDTTNNYNTVSNSAVTENNYYNTTSSAVTENNYHTDTTNNYHVVSGGSVVENNYHSVTNSAVTEENHYTDTTNNYNTVTGTTITENNYYEEKDTSNQPVVTGGSVTNNYITEKGETKVVNTGGTPNVEVNITQQGTESTVKVVSSNTGGTKKTYSKRKVGGITYKVNKDGKTCSVYKADASLKNVSLPNKVKIKGKNYKVKYIAEGVFRNNKNLKSIKVGRFIRGIKDFAFSGCPKLSKVKFKTRFLKINYHAFYRCNSLKEFTFNGRRIEIQFKTFEKCKNLKKVSIKGIDIKVRYRAFYRCKKLGKVRYRTIKDKVLYGTKEVA